MTETHEVTVQDVNESLELRGVFLHECHMQRGDAKHVKPGRVGGDIEITFQHDDPKTVVYLVSVTTTLFNSDEELMAEIKAAFAAVYDSQIDATKIPPPLLETYGHAARLQVHPYLREFIASISTRMGLPMFTAPVLRAKA